MGPIDSPSRLAIVFRIWLSGSSWKSPSRGMARALGAAGGGAGGTHGRAAGGSRARRRGARGGGSLDVALDDPSIGAGALNALQVEATLRCQPASERRRA